MRSLRALALECPNRGKPASVGVVSSVKCGGRAEMVAVCDSAAKGMLSLFSLSITSPKTTPFCAKTETVMRKENVWGRD